MAPRQVRPFGQAEKNGTAESPLLHDSFLRNLKATTAIRVDCATCRRDQIRRRTVTLQLISEILDSPVCQTGLAMQVAEHVVPVISLGIIKKRDLDWKPRLSSQEPIERIHKLVRALGIVNPLAQLQTS